jgi:DNA adenine methylase
MLRSPLRWVGGKYRVREKIIAKFPPHVCYVELFSGAAWVLFCKPPETSKSEVLNDLDGELVNFWRVVKHRPDEFTEAASWLLASRELFDEWKQFPGVAGEVARAVRFYLVIRTSFGARRVGSNFGMRPSKRPEIFWPSEKLEVKKVIDRLRVVWVERLTWEKCIQNYDRATTFFYVDPPYRADGAKAYRHFFTDEDHAKLADVLRGSVKGKWLLSYNDDAFIRQLYRGRGITIEPLQVPYSLAGGCRKAVGELLIRNF